MDQAINTLRDNNSTIRVVPQGGTFGDRTFRPGVVESAKSSSANDFLIKGKIYHCIKCLSDNSGEAQVFLVECFTSFIFIGFNIIYHIFIIFIF